MLPPPTPNIAIGTLTRAAWKAASSERARFYGFLALFVLAYVLELLVPWAIGYSLNAFVQSGVTEDSLWIATQGVIAYVILRLGYTLCHHMARYLQNTVAYSARMLTLHEVFKAMLSFPLNWHVNHHSGENLSKLHRAAGAIESTIGLFVWQIVEGVVKVALATAALATLDLWVALNVLLMGLLTVAFMLLFNKKLTSRIRENNSFYDKINRICVDYLFNFITVKSLSLENSASNYLWAERGAGLKVSQAISFLTELKWATVSVGYALVTGTSLILYFYSHGQIGKTFQVAEVYVLLSYLDKIFAAIGSFTGYYGGVLEAATAYDDADKILSDCHRHLQLGGPEKTLPKDWKRLALRNLEFSYVKGELAGLKGIKIDIERGEKIALVGPSGGGKSTLLRIMGGFLEPDRYELIADEKSGVDVTSIANRSLLLPQEPEIFSETVLYNLTMGGKFGNEELHFFAALCKLDGVIKKLPQGWETNLSEKGLNLSVGEKQRCAMARGLLRVHNKDFLLLDEPTSSLDPFTEKEIFYGLLHHFADRTIITACHRLALVPLFDKVVFVRAGEIEEVGSFEELRTRGGLFSKSWEDYEKKILKDHL